METEIFCEKALPQTGEGGTIVMALLEVKNLGISFGGLRAVDNFEVNIEKGQLYGLIGTERCGKNHSI